MDINKLVEIYGRNRSNACIVAELCDEVLDKSGKLLGEIREASRLLKMPPNVYQQEVGC